MDSALSGGSMLCFERPNMSPAYLAQRRSRAVGKLTSWIWTTGTQHHLLSIGAVLSHLLTLVFEMLLAEPTTLMDWLATMKRAFLSLLNHIPPDHCFSRF